MIKCQFSNKIGFDFILKDKLCYVLLEPLTKKAKENVSAL